MLKQMISICLAVITAHQVMAMPHPCSRQTDRDACNNHPLDRCIWDSDRQICVVKPDCRSSEKDDGDIDDSTRSATADDMTM